jgi:hypothetical protein
LETGFYARDRRSLIGFKLGDIDPVDIQRARLRLNLVPSGLGFVSSLPEVCRFEVYGIRDDAAIESWPAEGLRWEDAPGSTSDHREQEMDGVIDPTDVRLLGHLDIPRGKVQGPVVFDDPRILDFVRKDRTGEVGFLLVRATPPLDGYSLVHSFAASSHPGAAGPSLELELEDPEKDR